MLNEGYLVAILVLLSFSFGDTIGKRVSARFGNYASAIFVLGFGIVPLLISLPFFPHNLVGGSGMLLAVAAGFFLALGYVLVYKSLETEQASNTWALLNVSAAAAALFGIFALKEVINFFQLVSILLIFAGVIPITLTRKFKPNRLLIPAIAGNLSWAMFLVLIVYSISTNVSGTVAMFLVARVAGFLMLLAYLAATGKMDYKLVAKLKHPNRAAVVFGVFDGLGQTFYTLVILLQFVVVGAAITALEPAVVMVLGLVAYKEKLTRIQFTGLVVSVLAVVALGLV